MSGRPLARVGTHLPQAMRSAVASARKPLSARARIDDEKVHASRKAIKRARAMVRLAREALGDDAYARENRALRDAGRLLSLLRDSQSLLVAVSTLSGNTRTIVDPRALNTLARELRASKVEARRRFLASGPSGLNAYKDRLQALDRRIDQLRPCRITSGMLRRALRRAYKRGRKRFARAERNREPDVLHEWRKQVKYLANMLALVSIRRSNEARVFARRLERLGDMLGEDHDLALVAGRMRDKARAMPLLALLRKRQQRLQRAAFKAGEKVYAAAPAVFARSIQFR